MSSTTAVLDYQGHPTGTIEYWYVRILECQNIGMSEQWDVRILGCQSNGMSAHWDDRTLGCQSIGMSECWDLSEQWDVTATVLGRQSTVMLEYLGVRAS